MKIFRKNFTSSFFFRSKKFAKFFISRRSIAIRFFFLANLKFVENIGNFFAIEIIAVAKNFQFFGVVCDILGAFAI